MQIFVNTTNNVPLSSAHRSAVQTRVTDALAAIEHNVVSVSVFIADTNGPKGGADITCRMVAEVPAGPALVAEDTAASIDIAAQAAADELVARIRRYWDRRNTKDRHQKNGLSGLGAAGGMPPDAIDAADIVASLPR